MLKFGADGQYTLDERALRHIVEGEFSKRIETNLLGKRTAVEVISGGLHTWTAWEAFLRIWSGFVHLADFDDNLHKGWYFSREMQNGVIALKIPRELFSGDAASITMQPDLHFKSGYLWKTLFPKHFNESEVIRVIQEALENISIAESEIGDAMSIIIGYANLENPFKAMRVRVQLQGCEIRSAFPSWDQPSTGNNGKPYSPEQSVMFTLAASTIGVTNQSIRCSQLFKRTGSFDLSALVRITPSFIMKRSFPKYGTTNDEWRGNRLQEIKRVAEDQSIGEVEKSIAYLNDFCISKEPFYLQTMLCHLGIDEILRISDLGNLSMIMQNVADCYVLLLHWDNLRGERKFLECSVRFLAMGVMHTGFINVFEYKRLIKLIIQCASEHHAKDAIKVVIESIAWSPTRGALYSEVNIHPNFKSNDPSGFGVIGYSNPKVPITKNLLYDWAATNLGENYLVAFSKEQRLRIARAFVTQNTNENFVERVLRYFVGADFDFFAETLQNFVDLMDGSEIPSEAALIDLVREYDRMLLIYRQRIVLEDVDSYRAELDYELAGTEEFFKIIKQKHKRSYVVFEHEQALSAMKEFSKLVGYRRLEKRVENLQRKMGKERIPMPATVPVELRKWDADKERSISLDDFAANPFLLKTGA